MRVFATVELLCSSGEIRHKYVAKQIHSKSHYASIDENSYMKKIRRMNIVLFT